MTDDDARDLLRPLAAATPGTPPGYVRVPSRALAELPEPTALAVWIANQGGMVEPADEETFLVPQRALDGG